MIWILFNI